MKKTLALIFMMCSAAHAVEYTLTPSPTTPSSTQTATILGFAVDFSSTAFDWSTATNNAEVLNLTSITLTTTSTDSYKLAIYKVADTTEGLDWSSSTSTGWVALNEFESLEGLSAVASKAADSNTIKFSFGESGVALDMDGYYAFLFVSSSTEALTLSSTTASNDTLAEVYYNTSGVKESLSLTRYSSSSGIGDLNKSNTTGGLGKWNSGTSPVASYTFTIPEPATATLSLLALAGLAARRRRK